MDAKPEKVFFFHFVCRWVFNEGGSIPKAFRSQSPESGQSERCEYSHQDQ